MEIFHAILIGAVQGITEILPVSSSGHVLLLSNLLDIDLTISGIAILHLGTLVSIIIVMWDQIKKSFNLQAAQKILIAIIPAGLLGLLINDWIDLQLEENPTAAAWTIITALIVWGVIMLLVDRHARSQDIPPQEIKDVSNKQALAVGLGQALALIPGTSRSGVTTIFGILSGLSAETALAFSFISGIPLIAAAGLFSTYKEFSEASVSEVEIVPLAIATVTSLVVGIVAAYILKKFINKGILSVCAVYRIVVAILIGLTFLI